MKSCGNEGLAHEFMRAQRRARIEEDFIIIRGHDCHILHQLRKQSQMKDDECFAFEDLEVEAKRTHLIARGCSSRFDPRWKAPFGC